MKAARQQLDITSIFWIIPATLFERLPIWPALLFFGLSAILSIPTLMFHIPERFTDVALVTLGFAAALLGVVFAVDLDGPFLIGLLLYGAGLPFYFLGNRPWMHTIWHVFVCGAWGFHAWG